MITRCLVALTLVLPAACSSPPEPRRADPAQSGPLAQAGEDQAPLAVPTRVSSPADPESKARAVLQGLRWLVRHQNPAGSWGGSFGQRCTPEGTCAPSGKVALDQYDVGLTGLGLLACLRGGFRPDSNQQIVDTTFGRRYRTAEITGRAVAWLSARQQPNGSFSPRAFLYNDAIATLALCEASRLTNDAGIDAAAQRAIDFIQDAQRPSPDGQGSWGWRYAPRADIEEHGEGGRRELVDSDSSITAWCAMALASARRAGLNVRPESVDGALAFARWTGVPTGLAGYLDPKGAGAKVTGPNDHYVYHPAAMSALNLSTRILTAGDFSDPFLEKAAGQILKDLPEITEDRLSIDYYYWHAGTQALALYDGPSSPRATAVQWDAWNAPLCAAVLDLQDHTEKGCSNGGWLVPDRWGAVGHGGALYATALCVMTLMEPATR